MKEWYHDLVLLTDAPMDWIAEEVFRIFQLECVTLLQETCHVYPHHQCSLGVEDRQMCSVGIVPVGAQK